MINWLLDLFQDRTFGAIRSPKWDSVRKAHLKRKPWCIVCTTKGSFLNRIEVHHVKPFHLHPELELVDDNLISLCRDHHLLFGHLLNWKSYNPKVEEDAVNWSIKIKTRP